MSTAEKDGDEYSGPVLRTADREQSRLQERVSSTPDREQTENVTAFRPERARCTEFRVQLRVLSAFSKQCARSRNIRARETRVITRT